MLMTTTSTIQRMTLRKVWFRRSPPANPTDDWHFVSLTALGVAAARETFLTATLPFATAWTDLFRNMLAPGEHLRWRGSGPGTGRDARVAYSSLLGRYMARAYLMGNEGVRVLVPLDAARRGFRNSPYYLARPPREPALEADWIGLDRHRLIIGEAKGSFDKGTTTWSGPSSVPRILRNAIQQAQRTNVFRSPATTPLPAKRWAIASRWGNEENGFEPTLLAWDPEEEALHDDDYQALAKLLHESDIADILRELGHPDAVQLLYASDTAEPIPGEFPILVGRRSIEAGFSAALGPIGIVPLRERRDLDWVHRMRDLDMHIALVSMSGHYVRTISRDPRAFDEDELVDPNKVALGDDSQIAKRAGLTVAWPRPEDVIDTPRD